VIVVGRKAIRIELTDEEWKIVKELSKITDLPIKTILYGISKNIITCHM